MTVGELRKKLEKLDENALVVVSRDTDDGADLFEVTDVALATGDPRRNEETRKAGFKFDKDGPATWLFITIEEA